MIRPVFEEIRVQTERSSHLLNPGVRKREVAAWAMFDFANSGYTTVVITAVYNAYFVGVVAGRTAWATFAWTAALAVANALVILTAPAIGAYADLRACKKRLLAWTTVGCVLGTAALAWTGPGTLALAIALVVVSNFCFGTGENLIAAFLPELGRAEALGKISGWGWSLGYVGGLLALGLCLGWIAVAEQRGLSATQAVPGTLLLTAVLFALASLPTFLLLRERAVPQQPAAGATGGAGGTFGRLADTLHHARRYKDLARFLVCVVCYQAGVSTVIAIAAIYAEAAFGFTTAETIQLVLLVNVTAALGAFGFGQIQDRFGHVRTIAATLLVWLATALLAYFATTRPLFWLVANLAGLALGASQSAGRALVGYLSPEDRRAEFFGLWGLAVKLSQILGPLTFGLVTWITHGDQRTAMLVTSVFFVAGLAILAGVNVERGRRAAVEAA
jgi:UMF1 family MFS transporter